MPSPLQEILDFDFLGLVAAIALNMLELVGFPAADLTIFFSPFPFLFHLPSTALHPYLQVYTLFIIYFIMCGFGFYNRTGENPCIFFFLASYFIPSGAVVE